MEILKIDDISVSYGNIRALSNVSMSVSEGDIVALIGKGHEEYQEIQGVKHFFSEEQVVADFTNKEDLKVIGKDIRFIKTGDVAFAPKGRFFAGSLAYYLWYLVPLCLFIAFAVIYRKQVKENANMAKVRTKKANKVAAKRMKQAARLLAANQKGEFYDEVLKALWGYISDKLNIPVSQLSKGNIAHELSQHGVDEELTKEFIDTLDQCEFARYAPGDESAAMDNVYTLAVNVISKMENTIKH